MQLLYITIFIIIMKEIIQGVLRKGGIQLKRYPDPDLSRRIKLLKNCAIDTILDIGANDGGYAMDMRKHGYTKKIISFEPLKNAFIGLTIASSRDKNWIVNNYAIGDADTTSVINVAENSLSSSILNMLPAHTNSAPESRYIARQEIEIRKIDSVFDEFCTPEDHILMKVDTQGFEKNVIDGASESLKHIRVIQLEMSIIPLYESEMLYLDMIQYMDKKGFHLFTLENGFSDPDTGQILQIDGFFMNKNYLQKV